MASANEFKLSVNGAAIFSRAVVKNHDSWPDYVFDSTYQLNAIQDVAAYIKANKHLPEVPSADSIRANGIDLSANQAILLS